jgi:microcystin-dependent protein
MSKCNNCEGDSQSKKLKGPRGLRGEAGPAGPVGISSASVIGPKGDQGDPGQDGNNGLQGYSAYEVWKMLPGNAGKTETQFITAITGTPGTPPTFVVGTVTAGPTPGVNAVTVGNVCTLNFVLAQGPTGAPGSIGGPGPQGAPGPNSLVYKRLASSTLPGSWNDNTGNYETATVLNISKTSLAGYTGIAAVSLNADDWNQGIIVDSFIQIISRIDSTKFGIYRVVSMFDNTSYMSYTVIKIAASGLSSSINEEVTISYTIPGNSIISTASVTVPIGIIWPIGTQNTKALPAGWLLCDGAPYAIATYPALFAEIGTSFAQPGDPINVFRVPDLIDRVPYGCIDGNVGTVVGDNAIVGTITGTASTVVTGTAAVAVTGTAAVNIDVSNLPQHTHAVTGLSTDLAGDHQHFYNTSNSGGGSLSRADSGGADNDQTIGTSFAGQHSHPISGTIDNAGSPGTTQATGAISGTGSGPISGFGTGTITGSVAGDNRQKGLSLRFMIKY